jgi:hypothetical protein
LDGLVSFDTNQKHYLLDSREQANKECCAEGVERKSLNKLDNFFSFVYN